MVDNKEVMGNENVSMISKIGAYLTKWSMKYMPDPSIFAVVLTIIALILGMVIANQSFMSMIKFWYKGFWELLAFAMQMCLIIITGSAVAETPIARKGISKLARWPKSGKQAVWLVTFVSVLVSFLHWGLSLILGALLAKELAKQLKVKSIPFEYGLIAAGAYVGQMTWQGTFSSSIGLLIATKGHFLEDKIGIIPISQYVFNNMNIVVTILLLVLVPIFAYKLHPAKEHIAILEDDVILLLDKEAVISNKGPSGTSVGDRLNDSRVLAYAFAAMGFVYIFWHFSTKGFELDINMVNAIFLFIGIVMHGNIANYIAAVKSAVGGVSGIIFQFPLYAGIMGMIKYSGLVGIFAAGIVSISTPFTFYLWTFLSSSVINMFVPSGGGQWAVQGPVAIQSAQIMNADIIKTALAVGYGNTWTNMFQPFWAIALLGVTGLKAKDIMGYTTAIMIMSGLIFILPLLFL